MWDYENMFSVNQAVTATGISDNVVKVPTGDIGKGRPIRLQINAGGYTGNGTIVAEVQSADNPDMTSAVTIATFPIANADIVKGNTIKVGEIPTGAKEYLRLNYVISGGLSGGKLTSGLVLEGQTAV